MRLSTIAVGIALLGWTPHVSTAAAADAAKPAFDPLYELADWPTPANALDDAVFPVLEQRGIAPGRPCSDQVYLRRVYLDLIGTLPLPEEWLAFTRSTDPDKRAKLVDALMARDEFADYWSLKWCDVLRVKAEFPINLWPNAVQAYHRWIRDAVRENRPYDEFARDLLTSSGSNFRVPPVNFYRAMQGRDAKAIAEAVALTFMGSRIAIWPEDQRAGFTAFFTRVAYKKTQEWKEEIVLLDPAPAEPLEATFPDGQAVQIPAGQDPRFVFADWFIQPDNPWFARVVVNRLWAWLIGRGVVHEPDDFRPDNPPSNPALLDALAQALVDSKWDLQQVIKLICSSRTYQQSAIPRSDDPAGEALFAHYIVRRLDAEVLADALRWLTGAGESYSSSIPEPFTWIPDDQRTIALADGSITSAFLEMFGRPPRDTGLFSERGDQASDAQRLFMLNSSDIQKRIERSGRFQGCVAWAQGDSGKLVDALYVNILSREPTAAEREAALSYFKTSGLQGFQPVADVCWALLNTKEFLYRH